MKTLVDKYSKEELIQLSQQSNSFAEFCFKIGYKADSTHTREVVKKRIDKYNIDISHFGKFKKDFIKRTEENIFIENSTAAQSTLRRWYKKGNYTSYICSICGQEPIWQGKELTLILDHINGSNHDNRLENLRWVCPNCNQQLDTTGSKNQKILAKKYYCIDCGKEISAKSIRCMDCFKESQKTPLSEMPVTRDELKELIYNKSFCQIGKQFHVSDNAIRKWCDKFNLPRTKTEIKKYSVDAWSKI